MTEDFPDRAEEIGAYGGIRYCDDAHEITVKNIILPVRNTTGDGIEESCRIEEPVTEKVSEVPRMIPETS